MKEPLLAKIVRFLLYITAFMPLIIFSQYISPFHFGKVVVFRSIVEITAVFYLLLWWQDRSYRPRKNKIFWAFLTFVGAFSLATVFSAQRYISFWGTLERMGGLWTFWHYFVFFVILTAVLKTQQQWEKFLSLTVVSGVLSAIYGFGQKTHIAFFIGSGNRERIFGTIGNAALFAGYEIVNFFLALTLSLRPNNSDFKKYFFGTAAVLNLLAIIMTVVRGSLMGLGVGLFVFLALYYVNFRSKKAKNVLLILATSAALFFLVVITPMKHSSFIGQSRFLSRLTDTSFEAFTAKTRFWAWQAGLKGWQDGPKTMLVGWGPEAFNVPFSKYFNPKFFVGIGSETFFDRAHNMFVEVLVTMGIVGLAAYLGLYWAAFKSLIRIGKKNPQNRLYTVGFISLIIAYAIHNSFIFDTSANFLVFFSILGFITFLNLNPSEEAKDKNHYRRFSAGTTSLAGLMFIGVLILVYKTNILPSKANYATTRGIIRGWTNDSQEKALAQGQVIPPDQRITFADTIAKYREAATFDGPGKYEFRNRYAQYLLEHAAGKRINPELEVAIKEAIVLVQKNADENKADYLPELYIARLNVVLGGESSSSPYNDESLRHSMRALEISPTFIRTYFEIAQAYINKKDYEKAVEYFRRAVELNPDTAISYWYWGMTEIERGNVQVGLNLVQESINKGNSLSEDDYLKLANIFIKINNYPKIVQIYEQLVKLAPINPQYWAALAVASAKVGNIDEAVAAAHRAAQVDPGFEAEAKRFVEQLGRQW